MASAIGLPRLWRASNSVAAQYTRWHETVNGRNDEIRPALRQPNNAVAYVGERQLNHAADIAVVLHQYRGHRR
jgi:hypothetical protein